MKWAVLYQICRGLQAGRAYMLGDFNLRAHFHGPSLCFEVSNFAHEPPFIHAFSDAFEAAWFLVNLADGEVAELTPHDSDRVFAGRR